MSANPADEFGNVFLLRALDFTAYCLSDENSDKKGS